MGGYENENESGKGKYIRHARKKERKNNAGKRYMEKCGIPCKSLKVSPLHNWAQFSQHCTTWPEFYWGKTTRRKKGRKAEDRGIRKKRKKQAKGRKRK